MSEKYIEDRVDNLEGALINLLMHLIDYECPKCGSDILYADDDGFFCGGCGKNDDYTEYSLGQVVNTITSTNKPLKFHPKKVY